MVSTYKNNKASHKKIVQQYIEDEIKITIEMPEPNKDRDREAIDEIRSIMNNELLLQINK